MDTCLTLLIQMTMEELFTKSLVKEVIAVKYDPVMTPIQQPEPTQPARVSSSQPEKKTVKPRLSLVERQSLKNPNRTSDPTSHKRRISSLLKPNIPDPTPPDIFRFPSESPPKQSPIKRTSIPKPTQLVVKDKENVTPLSTWPVVVGGRERRRTFNATMEKLAQMTREEMQADKEWETALANKRRRQSVAI
jgi:hypothetical protein